MILVGGNVNRDAPLSCWWGLRRLGAQRRRLKTSSSHRHDGSLMRCMDQRELCCSSPEHYDEHKSRRKTNPLTAPLDKWRCLVNVKRLLRASKTIRKKEKEHNAWFKNSQPSYRYRKLDIDDPSIVAIYTHFHSKFFNTQTMQKYVCYKFFLLASSRIAHTKKLEKNIRQRAETCKFDCDMSPFFDDFRDWGWEVPVKLPNWSPRLSHTQAEQDAGSDRRHYFLILLYPTRLAASRRHVTKRRPSAGAEGGIRGRAEEDLHKVGQHVLGPQKDARGRSFSRSSRRNSTVGSLRRNYTRRAGLNLTHNRLVSESTTQSSYFDFINNFGFSFYCFVTNCSFFFFIMRSFLFIYFHNSWYYFWTL